MGIDNTKIRENISRLFLERRNYKQEIKDLVKERGFIVFYGCGRILNSVIETWNKEIGREINYCCDSDNSKWGQYFHGVKCISPQELIAIKDKCTVFVTVGDFNAVLDFLRKNSFPSFRLLYKYDLEISRYLYYSNKLRIIDKLCQTYAFLEDDQSKKVFLAILNRVMNKKANIEIMANVYEKNQYFPEEVIKLTDRESFVDIGAFDGDTIQDFIKRVGKEFDSIFSFEIDQINFDLLKENIKYMPNRNRIKVFNLGIWDSECDIAYTFSNSSSTVGYGAGKGHVMPLDDCLAGQRVTYIKMDIEGAEFRALRGSKEIIKTQKPRLAVCIYHDFRHLWEIPIYIKSLVPEYKIYLRHHTRLEYETVCYAVV